MTVVVVVVLVWLCGGGSVACDGCISWGCGCCGGGVLVVVKALEKVAVVIFVVAL